VETIRMHNMRHQQHCGGGHGNEPMVGSYVSNRANRRRARASRPSSSRGSGGGSGSGNNDSDMYSDDECGSGGGVKIHTIGIRHDCGGAGASGGGGGGGAGAGAGPNAFLSRVVQESGGSFTPFTHDMAGIEAVQVSQNNRVCVSKCGWVLTITPLPPPHTHCALRTHSITHHITCAGPAEVVAGVRVCAATGDACVARAAPGYFSSWIGLFSKNLKNTPNPHPHPHAHPIRARVCGFLQTSKPHTAQTLQVYVCNVEF
jgi:hypothetical protein